MKNEYTLQEIEALYHKPLADLMFQAHQIHREFHDPNRLQKCSLLSIKTGGCSEDCAYCAQSAHYKTNIVRHKLITLREVKKAICNAKKEGATRLCMGAAWKQIKSENEFELVLEMVQEVKSEGLEACVTLGQLSEDQARALKKAGLDVYNHNLDTSPRYYQEIITTHTFQDRLDTLKRVNQAGLKICSGGILGMGETISDRCHLLHELSRLNPQPESVPINLLIPVAGTPLEHQKPIDIFHLVRTIAVARILMPRARVKLSAGRTTLSREAHILCFFSGANSLFIGDKLLTKSNPSLMNDNELFKAIDIIQ